MKKFIILGLFVMLPVFIFGEKNSYTVGVNSNEIYSFELQGNEPARITAFEQEFILEVAKRGNFKIEFLEDSFILLLSKIENNTLDMAIDLITVTDERKKTMHFSEAYITTNVVILGNKNNKPKTEDKLVYGITVGSYFKDFLQNKSNIVIEKFDTSELIKELLKNEFDCIVIDKISSDEYLKKYPSLYIVKTLGNESIAIAFSKSLSKDFTDKVDKIIIDMKLDGSLNRLKNKYDIKI